MKIFRIKSDKYLDEETKYFCFMEPFDANIYVRFLLSVIDFEQQYITDKTVLKFLSKYRNLICKFDIDNIRQERSMDLKTSIEDVFNANPEVQPVPVKILLGQDMNKVIDELTGCFCIPLDSDIKVRKCVRPELMRQVNSIKMDINNVLETNYINSKGIPTEIAALYNTIKGYLEWLLNSTSVRKNKIIDYDIMEVEMQFRNIEQFKKFVIERIEYLKQNKEDDCAKY